jgi:glutamyl-tRNA reductase
MKRLMRGDDPQDVLNAMAQGLTNKFLHGSLHTLQHSNGAERDSLIKLLPKLFSTHSSAYSHTYMHAEPDSSKPYNANDTTDKNDL